MGREWYYSRILTNANIVRKIFIFRVMSVVGRDETNRVCAFPVSFVIM